MKKMRKLIPALSMLLVAALMLVTSSYAWFSMNNQVTAEGIEITAKSDAAALVINRGDTFNAVGTDTSLTSAGVANLKPVAPVKPFVAGTIASGFVGQPENWHYSYSNNTGSSTSNGKYTVVQGTLTGDGYYVSQETYQVGFNSNIDPNVVNAVTTNLKLSVVIPEAKGLHVVVVVNETTLIADVNSDATLDLLVKPSTGGARIDVYYYISGEDTNVYTNNLAALKGKINLTFTY